MTITVVPVPLRPPPLLEEHADTVREPRVRSSFSRAPSWHPKEEKYRRLMTKKLES